MKARSDAAAGSDPRAERAAAAALHDGGSAIDALIAGFMAAAAHEPAVLCAPCVALFGGVGAGARCLDGRALQPGRDAVRPRGIEPGRAIPPAAGVAVPRTPALLAALHTYGARRSLGVLTREAVTYAKQVGQPQRADLIAAIGRVGGAALRAPGVDRALLRAAGVGASGLLTEGDLAQATPDDTALEVEPLAGKLTAGPGAEPGPLAKLDGAWLRPAERGVAAQRADAFTPRILVAADARGLVGGLCYWPDVDGLEVPELEITLARCAHPVLRGVRRVAPGTVLEQAVPLAILRRGAWYGALGAAARVSFDRAALLALGDGASTVVAGAANDSVAAESRAQVGLEQLAAALGANGLWLASSERRRALVVSIHARSQAPA